MIGIGTTTLADWEGFVLASVSSFVVVWDCETGLLADDAAPGLGDGLLADDAAHGLGDGLLVEDGPTFGAVEVEEEEGLVGEGFVVDEVLGAVEVWVFGVGAGGLDEDDVTIRVRKRGVKYDDSDLPLWIK